MDDGENTLGAIYAQVRRQQQKKNKSTQNNRNTNTKKRYRDNEENDDNSSSDKETSLANHTVKHTGNHRSYSHSHPTTKNESSSSDSEESNAKDDNDNSNEDEEDEAPEGITSTKSKNAPVELRANKPVSRFRQIVIVPRNERKDPRFEEKSGKLNEHQFTQNYDFLDTYRDDEIKALQNEIKKVKNIEERTAMKEILTKLLQQRADVTNRRAVQEVLHNQQKARTEAIEQGKNPYYPKQREIRELAAVERFKQLETKGGAALDKAIQKKRKKLASKDRKRLPMSSLPTRRYPSSLSSSLTVSNTEGE